MWVYPVAVEADSFAEIGSTRADAANVLGLGHLAVHNEPVVRFAHRLPAAVGAHQPTSWDAGDGVHWRPGGRTFCLDCDEYGLLEIVHDPITGEYLVAAIELLHD